MHTSERIALAHIKRNVIYVKIVFILSETFENSAIPAVIPDATKNTHEIISTMFI